METTLTTWEAKERAGLLALETDEWLEKRLIAEDPNATAETLERFSRDIVASDSAAFQARDNNPTRKNQAALLVDALVAHPNTPPVVLARLLNRSPSSARAFCHNPIAPFLLLEMPDFVVKLRSPAIYRLLREEHAPPPIVRAFAALPHPPKGVSPGWDEQVWEINLHVMLSGEIQSQAEFDEQFKIYWREKYEGCFVLRTDGTDMEQELHEAFWRSDVQALWDLYETGLLPAWAGTPLVPLEPRAPALSDHAMEWLRFTTAPNTPEEAALWAEIAPDLTAHSELAAFLRADASESVLAELVGYEKTESGALLLAMIASHPNATPPVLERLLETKSSGELLRFVALHPNVSPKIIAQLVQCSDAATRRIARRHPDAPQNSVDLSRAAFLDQKQNGSFFTRLIAYQHGGLTVETLAGYATTIASYLRVLAALGLPTQPVAIPDDEFDGCTTRDLLQHLAHDGNRFVRWAAQTRLADPDFVFTWDEKNTQNSGNSLKLDRKIS